MKNFKKIFSLVLATVAFASVFSFAGCDGDDNPPVQYSQFKSGDGSLWDRYEVEQGTYRVEVTEEDQELYFSFFTNKVGTYSVSSSGASDTVNPKVEFCNATAQTLYLPGEGNDDKSSSDKNFYYEFEVKERFLFGATDDQGNPALNPEHRENFLITIDDSTVTSYPVSFDVTFKFENDYTTPPVTYETIVIETSETLTKLPDSTGDVELQPVPYAITPVYNEDDGYYHIGSKTGEIIYVYISSTPSRYIDRPFTKVNEFRNCLLLTTKNAQDEIVIHDYSELIIEVYPEYCNNDGVYPVNQELYTFLNLYIVGNRNDVTIPASTPSEKKWLAPCCYYAPVTNA